MTALMTMPYFMPSIIGAFHVIYNINKNNENGILEKIYI